MDPMMSGAIQRLLQGQGASGFGMGQSLGNIAGSAGSGAVNGGAPTDQATIRGTITPGLLTNVQQQMHKANQMLQTGDQQGYFTRVAALKNDLASFGVDPDHVLRLATSGNYGGGVVGQAGTAYAPKYGPPNQNAGQGQGQSGLSGLAGVGSPGDAVPYNPAFNRRTDGQQ